MASLEGEMAHSAGDVFSSAQSNERAVIFTAR